MTGSPFFVFGRGDGQAEFRFQYTSGLARSVGLEGWPPCRPPNSKGRMPSNIFSHSSIKREVPLGKATAKIPQQILPEPGFAGRTPIFRNNYRRYEAEYPSSCVAKALEDWKLAMILPKETSNV